MKNRILPILLVVAVALSVGLIGCRGEEVPETMQYTLTISSTDGGSVTTPGEGSFTYDEGTDVDLVAEAEEGYQFVEWTGDMDDIGDVEDATTSITMNSNYTIITNFEAIPPIQYSLTISSTDGGEVINPGEGTFTYNEGMTIDLLADPQEGYHFVGWTGDVGTIGNASAASTNITMNDNYSVTASFEEIPLGQVGLTISSTTGGSVTLPGEGTFAYDPATVVNLVANPLSGYQFAAWTGDVSTIANLNAPSTTITMNNDYSIVANFDQIPVTYYTLTLGTNGSGSTSPSAGQHTYLAGTVVSITATPATCCGFINWTGNVGTVGNVNAASTTITMNDNYSITANFEEEVVTFPDPNLEAAIRGAIGKPTGPIYPSDLEGFTYFSGGANMNIADLSGLGCCTNLEYLYLYSNQISDISPLTNLVNLVYLHLGWNQISDISALGNLINLYGLHLEGNQIDDVSPLADLTNLTVLDLDGNSWISDISPLSSLTNLTSLSLDGNRISDISTLANLTNLTTLHLCFNQISDISPLSSLANLEELTLGVNEISTISALGSLTNLSYLYFGDNQISDISPLSTLTSLSYLQANANQISDISSLSSLINLTSLHLGSNQISGFSALSSLTNLTSLDLQQNQICDISPLNSLTNLENLHLGNNEISDISPLSSLANLRYLYLLGNYLGDISPLVENTGLGPADYVNLQYNYLDLTPGSEAMNDIQDLLGRGVVVYYEPQSKYDLVVSSTTGGAVTLPGEGIFACDPGTVVSLAATPLSNCYQFGYWTGDVGAIANVNAPSTTITMNDNYSITAYFPRVVDLANTELHEAATAIICCLADAGTDLLTSPSGNATAVWRGELAVIYACGAGNVTYDAADYISGPFRAEYTVTGYGQIVDGNPCAAAGQWGNCIVWDADYMCWIETP